MRTLRHVTNLGGLLRQAARFGRLAFALAFAWKAQRDEKVARYAPVILYRTLGNTLSPQMAPVSSLWGIYVARCVLSHKIALRLTKI